MSTKLINYEDMTDSREMLEKKSPAFISWFLLLLTIILIVLVAWSWFAKMDIVVKAPGVVRPNDKISKIVNKASGSVSKVYVEQGQKVNVGDKLFSIKTGTLKNDKVRLTEEYEKTTLRLNGLEKLYAAVKLGNQDKIQTYANRTLLDNDNPVENKLKLDISKTISDLEETNQTISNKRLLIKSLNYGQNYLDSSSIEFERYENFKLKISRNVLTERQLQEEYKRTVFNNDETSAITVIEKIKALQLQVEMDQSEFLLTIQTELDTAIEQKKNLEKQKADLYVQLQGSIDDLEKQQSETNSQLSAINTNLTNYTATAPIAGIINTISEIGEGQLIQEGLQVMDIVPINSTIYSVHIAMNHQDIGRIREGYPVRFHFSAFPREEYGSVIGKIQSIGSDALVNTQEGSSYYLVEASVETIDIRNALGREKMIKSGMQTEAFIVTEQKTALQWILEKMDFWSE
ncbi:HlyD family efflux transporter periplasmic adaptor subunit [Paenibacillus sp. F6_3S_P_1C]|uniref:HlyD family efflux transporter periplasmic adaptor subunit n=1 Tax=Paenibacillus vandeheii TaxID=3035917 RepID=A0ABT8J8T2_9BACL|nr:HlyD family efflux transporter periplasmic adaptor subunit [Paenibacillus vandeheii]MDN4601425.1 HlyD family efflux transporter periplasmic adaptor subunit [Paenibacillus vandeheii]